MRDRKQRKVLVIDIDNCADCDHLVCVGFDDECEDLCSHPSFGSKPRKFIDMRSDFQPFCPLDDAA